MSLSINNKYTKIWRGSERVAAFLGAMLVGFVAASMLAPVGMSEAATQTTTTDNDHTITLTMNDSLALDVVSTPEGAIASAVDNLSIMSDAPNGYQLYISMSSNDENANRLTNSSDARSYYAPASGTFAAPAALGANSWGYAISSGTAGAPETIAFDEDYSSVSKTSTFSAVPLLDDAQLLQSTDAPNEEANTVDVVYAVHSNTAQAEGVYTGTITYTITADDPAPQIYMQDFTLAQCEALAYDTPITLIDRRDDKTYTVIRARDNNCWMTQDLKYAVAESTSWDTTAADDSVLLHITTTEGYEDNYFYSWGGALQACPAGWQLPINGNAETDKSYVKLLNAYGIDTLEKLFANKPLNFSSGFVGNYSYGEGKENYQGISSNYWTSTESAIGAYGFSYNTSDLDYGDFYKLFGVLVRCVFNYGENDLMQNFTLEMCEALATDAQRTLVDKRDGKFYTVTHAKDGNCWMTQNLALIGQTIYAEDSDFPSGSFNVPASSNWYGTNVTDAALAHLTSGYGVAATSDSAYYGYVFYNWYAATAGSTEAGDGVNVNTSICPRGWTLPRHGDENTDRSWASLMKAYGIGESDIDKLFASPLGFDKYYGWYSWGAGTETDQGSNLPMHSAAPKSAESSYGLHVNVGVAPAGFGYKGDGYSMRCVFDNRTLADISYMQDINSTICRNTAEGYSKALLDRRGRGNSGADKTTGYGVLRAKDGNCWMTQNLALIGQTIYAEDSDFSSGSFNVPASSTWTATTATQARVHLATNSGYEGNVYYNWSAAVAIADTSNITNSTEH